MLFGWVSTYVSIARSLRRHQSQKSNWDSIWWVLGANVLRVRVRGRKADDPHCRHLNSRTYLECSEEFHRHSVLARGSGSVRNRVGSVRVVLCICRTAKKSAGISQHLQTSYNKADNQLLQRNARLIRGKLDERRYSKLRRHDGMCLPGVNFISPSCGRIRTKHLPSIS